MCFWINTCLTVLVSMLNLSCAIYMIIRNNKENVQMNIFDKIWSGINILVTPVTGLLFIIIKLCKCRNKKPPQNPSLMKIYNSNADLRKSSARGIKFALEI